MAIKTLENLFYNMLRDIYYAEKRIHKNLPRFIKVAQSTHLIKALEKHLSETENHIIRLERIFELLGRTPKGRTCPTINGIITEGEEMLSEYRDSPALDAGIIACAQAVEHYEICRYGTLKAWAQSLDFIGVVPLLDQTLSEEYGSDELLTQLAQPRVNLKAVDAREAS
jgi:ferritin-like metal-binding protein YciE